MNNLSQFWQELKRRKVVRVITVYAAAAFVILELVSIIVEPLKLPEWTLPLIIVLLCIGFIIAVILSWIYDLNPEGGIVKTDPMHKIKEENKSTTSGGWRIATYVSVVIILGLLVYNFTSNQNSSKIDESLDKSIAVLPFLNLMGDPEQEHICVGLTDEIISRLFKIESFDKVVPLTTVIYYQDSDKSNNDIADELGVNYILTGSFKRIGGELRVTTQLIEPKTNNHIWLEDFDRPWEEIITIPANIALQIAEHLQSLITNTESQNISKSMTDNVEAYNLYLKGIYNFRTYTKIGNNTAREYIKIAITLDSSYAQAYSLLATLQFNRASVYSAELSALEALALGKPLLDKALAIDPDLPEAHLWNGYYLLYNNWDFSGTELEYKKGIVDDDPDALAIYADFLNFSTRHQEALIISERLTQTNPYYPNSRMAYSLFYLGEYKAATEYAESRIKLFNNNSEYESYGFLMLNTGNYEKAIQLFNKAVDVNRISSPRMLGWMGAAYARIGNKEKALELAEELKAIREQSGSSSTAFFIAVIYSALDDKALALQWLQAAYENHEMEMPWLQTEPQFYSLHDDPAFQDLINKVGFPNIGSVEKTDH